MIMKNPKVHREHNIVIKNNSNNSKYILYIGICILLIILIIGYYIITSNVDYYKDIKIEENKKIIYTKYEYKDITIPYINIVGEDINLINQDIDKYSEWYLANPDYSKFLYHYETSNNILSLLISTVSKEGKTSYDYKSYLIDLDTLRRISDDEILEFFKLNKANVSSYYEKLFRFYYDELVNKGYYNKNKCNYRCFLKNIEVNNYSEKISYYVSDNTLIGYRPFNIYSSNHEDEYFKNIGFSNVLAK